MYGAAHLAQAKVRKAEWRKKNAERYKSQNKAYYELTKDRDSARKKAKREADPEAARAKSRARYWANREKHREAVRRWTLKNKERLNAYGKLWYEANKEKCFEKGRRRRAQIQGATLVPFSLEQLDQRMSVFGHACAYCGGPFEEIDHVKPISRGGPHCLSNLRPACRDCNRRKWAKTPDEWRGTKDYPGRKAA